MYSVQSVGHYGKMNLFRVILVDIIIMAAYYVLRTDQVCSFRLPWVAHTPSNLLSLFFLEETCSLFLSKSSLSWKKKKSLDKVCRIVCLCVLCLQVIKGAAVEIRARRPMPRERRAAFSSMLKCASPAPRVTHSTAQLSGSASPTAPGRVVNPPANVSNSIRRRVH